MLPLDNAYMKSVNFQHQNLCFLYLNNMTHVIDNTSENSNNNECNTSVLCCAGNYQYTVLRIQNMTKDNSKRLDTSVMTISYTTLNIMRI
jgi:hypothetical protein